MLDTAHWKGTSLFNSAQQQLRDAASFLSLDTEILDALLLPQKAQCATLPLLLDNGKKVFLDAFRVWHNTALGPAKGGIRFHHEVSLSEVAGLAMFMSFKCSLAGIPLGGGKGGVCVAAGSLSPAEKQRLVRLYTQAFYNFIGPQRDIPAPDVGTNAQDMAWMLDEFNRISMGVHPAVVTGKPLELGGSVGRAESTGRGVVLCLQFCAEHLKAYDPQKSTTTATVHGFGKVGSVAALDLYDMGCKVIAVFDLGGGVFNAHGLDVPLLVEHFSLHKTLVGFQGAEVVSEDEFFNLKTDILIPAAIDGVITAKNAGKIQAKVIAEGANGPITPDAFDILEQKGIFVIPDILCNAGGVVVSYFEWVQNLQNFSWSEEQVNTNLKNILKKSFHKMLDMQSRYHVTSRQAAMMVAVDRMARAISMIAS